MNDPGPVRRRAGAPAPLQVIDAFGVAALGRTRRAVPVNWTVACWAAGLLMARSAVWRAAAKPGPTAVAGTVIEVEERMGWGGVSVLSLMTTSRAPPTLVVTSARLAPTVPVGAGRRVAAPSLSRPPLAVPSFSLADTSFAGAWVTLTLENSWLA